MTPRIGSCKIKYINCKYHLIDNTLYLIPITDKVSDLLKFFIRDKIAFIEIPISNSEEVISNYIYFSNYSILDGGISLNINMIYENYSNIELKGLLIYSDELNFYINPAEYFYEFKKKGTYKESDLLYQSIDINEFSFEFENKKVNCKISLGKILDRGIASDLKLKSYLEVNFAPTNDREFILSVVNALNKCFRFAIYNDEIHFKRIELIGDLPKRTISGSIKLNKPHIEINHAGILNSNYYYLKDFLGDFFQVVANDKNLFTTHIQNPFTKLSSENRLTNIFAAFETEFSKLPSAFKLNDTTNIEPFRQQILEHLIKIPISSSSEKQFYNQLRQNIYELGKTFGSRMKILNSIEYSRDCIDSSLKFFNIDEEQIKFYSKEIPRLRNKIVHNNYVGEINITLELGINLIEWITYSMLLKRMNIPSNIIELILSRTFNSNYVEFNK